MTETAGDDPRDGVRRPAPDPAHAPAPDPAHEPGPAPIEADEPIRGNPENAEDGADSRPRVTTRRGSLSREEQDFIRRYADDFPPHHDSRWG